MSKYLTANDVAEILGCSKNTAIAHMEKMNPINLGSDTRRQYRVTQNDLDTYLARLRLGYKQMHAPEPIRKGRKRSTPDAMQYADEFGRCLRMRNGQLVPMARPPR